MLTLLPHAFPGARVPSRAQPAAHSPTMCWAVKAGLPGKAGLLFYNTPVPMSGAVPQMKRDLLVLPPQKVKGLFLVHARNMHHVPARGGHGAGRGGDRENETGMIDHILTCLCIYFLSFSTEKGHNYGRDCAI